jgi:hypothetical protein
MEESIAELRVSSQAYSIFLTSHPKLMLKAIVPVVPRDPGF